MNCKKPVTFLTLYAKVYSQNEIPTASSALSYYLTMSFFPLIICLYSLLGNSPEKVVYILDMVERVVPDNTVDFLQDFLNYVVENSSSAMLAAGIAVLVSASSAAIRSIQGTIGKMQGGQRFQGLKDFLWSLVFSLIFLATMYFAILVMLSSKTVIELIARVFPTVGISGTWRYLRFPVLAGIELLIVWAVYRVSKRSTDSYATWPGAVFAAVGLAAVNLIFSVFIAVSAKYPLVYGSLASIILLMFWMYLCCMVIYLGAVLNITIREYRL